MKLIVTGRHLTVTDAVREAIDKRLRRLDRVLNDAAISAQMVLSLERGLHVCDLTVRVRGDHALHAVARHARLDTAAGAVVAKVAKQAQKLTGRWKTRRKDSRPAAPALPPAPAPAAPRVVRSRASGFKPMSLDDAVLTLQAASQPFLVYRDASSDSVAILYRRPDGHYGLIEPEA